MKKTSLLPSILVSTCVLGFSLKSHAQDDSKKSQKLFRMKGQSSAAQPTDDSEKSQKLFRMKEGDPIVESQIKILVNADAGFSTFSDAETKFTWDVGSNVDWFFTQNVGAFVGAAFDSYRSRTNGIDLKANYVDVPFGVGFDFLSGNSLALGSTMHDFSAIMNVGLYAGIPVSKFEATYNGVASNSTAKMVMGLDIEGDATHKITDNFGLGFHAGFKYGFNDANGSYNPYLISVGLGAQFL